MRRGKHADNASAVNLKKHVTSKKITMKKANLSAKILAAATLGFGIFTLAPAANAASLTPSIEGEIKTDLGCISLANCIDTTDSTQMPFTYSVKSLDYDNDNDGVGPKFGKSLLFADKRSTANNYDLGITFGTSDAGTNASPDQIWLRPSARLEDGSTFENGQLEVGRFAFDFLGKTASMLTLDLFDVEDKNFTGVLKVNGVALASAMYATVGADPNNKRQRLTLTNVQSFEIQLGKPGPDSVFSNTGDGVLLQASVPEPGNVVSLSVLAAAGVFGLRKGKKASQAN